MNRAQINALGFSAGVALVLTFLFIQQRPVDSNQHNRFTHNLLLTKQLDAEINRDLLRSRYELLSTYDPFVRNFKDLRKVVSGLQNIPVFINGKKRQKLLEAAKRELELLSQKEHLAEQFKTENAVLRNSFRYFPLLISQASLDAEQIHDDRYRTKLANLLRDVLLYDITPRAETAASIRRQLELIPAGLPDRSKTKFANVAAHADAILSGKVRVQEITERLIAVPLSRNIEEMVFLYTAEYDRTSHLNSIYRLLLYLFSVFLLGYAADRTLHLVKSRASLEKINTQLQSANLSLRDAKSDLQAKNEEIESTLQLLGSAQERYELAAKGANDGLWDWDLLSGKIFYSPRWKEMLGFGADELADSPETWIRRLHPDDRERVQAEWQDHFAGRTPVLESEHRMLHDDGTYRWMLSRGMAVRAADGKPHRMAGSQTDITGNKSKDSLTGLANRLLFNERLSRIICETKRGRRPDYAVLFLDVDRFKVINDSLGHVSGDILLRQIAERLTRCVRAADTICWFSGEATVARFGGDEFAILIDRCSNLVTAQKIADRILTAFVEPFHVAGREILSTLSVGVALGNGSYSSPEDILRDADIAMYEAKTSGRARVGIFNPLMGVRAVERMELEADMRRGIEDEQFTVLYQPKVNMESGIITGFEALIRWNHPTRGMISPAEFIPLAEETGLIVPLGYWILGNACQRLKIWQDEIGREDLSISVNISSRQFGEADLVNRVSAIVTETGLSARSLSLELTETAVMKHPESARTTLDAFKALGIGLEMDDFGTGYSSLSYLQLFPFDTIKIDKSFVSGLELRPQNRELIRTIVNLAYNFKMKVIAEGVETQEQAGELIALGCTQGQGYLYSKPVSESQAISLVLKNSSNKAAIAA